jgi:spermidine synthase
MDRNRAANGVLLGLFVGSGCSALVYEVVWFQQLGLVLGNSAISLAILLTSFMGGMCLGSIALPRLASKAWHPLRVYAVLELLIAICGLGSLWLLPAAGQFYWRMTDGGADVPMRSAVALVVLLPPTILMGATLPAMARWVESSREGLAGLGLFYGANTLGAMLGSLLAGLYLLPVYDVVVASSVAAAINVAVAAIAFVTSQRHAFVRTVEEGPSIPVTPSARTRVVGIVIAASGLTALGAEVIWTRLLGLLLGPTSYTFSIVLAIFLLGLGIGSVAGARLSRRVVSAGRALALCQLLLMAAIPYAAFVICHVLPRWLSTQSLQDAAWFRMSLDVVRTMVALLPATILWGASFPLAVAAAGEGEGHQRESDNGWLVGRLYCSNTLGAIIGTLCVGLFLIPSLGSQSAERFLTVAAGCSGVTMLLAMAFAEQSSVTFRARLGQGLVFACACPLMAMLVPSIPGGLLAYGHCIHKWNTIQEYHYVREGVDSTIVVATSTVGNRCFHISGKVEATTNLSDMRTQRMLGHLPALAHQSPRSVLVVGCGSGMTAGAMLLHPTVERVVICEMEASVIEASRENFANQNYGVLNDPRTHIVIDDARHFLATTDEQFDVITTDPIHPWVKGAAALYTSEFYEMCRNHLNRGGVVAQWIPLYESNEAAVKCELATFTQAFPMSSIWSGESRMNGYDVVAIGSCEESPDPSHVVRRIADLPLVCEALREVEIDSAETLQSLFAAYGSDLDDWLQGAEINRDRNLRLQYLAGLTPDGLVAQRLMEKISQKTRDTVSASRRQKAARAKVFAN